MPEIDRERSQRRSQKRYRSLLAGAILEQGLHCHSHKFVYYTMERYWLVLVHMFVVPYL